MTRKPACVRCGEPLDKLKILLRDQNAGNRGGIWDLCRSCLADSFDCPGCNRLVPKSENRGSYCRECRSEYNRAYAAKRKGGAHG
jgi:hypothetical protein